MVRRIYAGVLTLLMGIAVFLVLVPTALAQVPSTGDEGGLSNLAMYALVVGFFLPPVLALVQQQSWSTKLRASIAFIACVVAGAGTAYFQGDLTGRRFAEATLVILTTGMATYQSFWKPTEIAPRIERESSKVVGTGGEE